MHFFQTADAVEMALGKDISQSGATFYPIYSNTSKKYLTHYLPKPSRVKSFERRKMSKIGTLHVDSLRLYGPHIQTRRTLVHLLYH